MQTDLPLHPTLWRTCRVIANPTRLEVFRCLVQQPGQTVSAIASRLRLPLPIASLYLRAMEARGLLVVQRQGRWVKYSPSPPTARNAVSGLVGALKLVLGHDPTPAATVFKLATAFTHPRRIAIFRALQGGGCTSKQIRARLGISWRALSRHLEKLAARGFIKEQEGRYTVVEGLQGLRRELARMAIE